MAVAVARSKKDRQHVAWQEALRDAHEAGVAAAERVSIPVSYIGTPKNVMASLTGGDDGGFDFDQPVYRDSTTGPCGFAWVTIKGHRAFQNFLLGSVQSRFPAADALGDALHVRRDSYYGGVSLSVMAYGQSMMRKEAYAGAFACLLRERVAGLNAYLMSRLD